MFYIVVRRLPYVSPFGVVFFFSQPGATVSLSLSPPSLVGQAQGEALQAVPPTAATAAATSCVGNGVLLNQALYIRPLHLSPLISPSLCGVEFSVLGNVDWKSKQQRPFYAASFEREDARTTEISTEYSYE